jgi:hypothetical protein
MIALLGLNLFYDTEYTIVIFQGTSVYSYFIQYMFYPPKMKIRSLQGNTPYYAVDFIALA